MITKSHGSWIVEQESTYLKIQKYYQTLKKFLIEGLHTQIDNPIEYTKRICTKECIKIIIFLLEKCFMP